jgi:type II secretory pathway component GspD/PulD (secretin)
MRPRLFTLAPVLLIPLIHLYPSYAQEAKPSRDPIVIRVIHLDYADAEYLASVLAPLLSKEGRVVAYRPTNSLIIKDRASLVKTLVKIIKGEPDRCPPYLSP